MENPQACLYCGTEIKGRYDKKYCDDTCRNSYHNQQNKENNAYVRGINSQLKRNRKILEELNTQGKTTKHKDELLKRGFDFKYHTHQYTTKSGSTYHFVYEHGYLALDNDFYMLVVDQKWKNS